MAALPAGFVPPIPVALARSVDKIPEPGALPGNCRYEPKWDGFRALILVDGDGVSVWSRRGTSFTEVFPELVDAALEQVSPGWVLDGEIVAWRDGRLDFEALQHRLGRSPRNAAILARRSPTSYAMFDVLAADGRDVRGEPFDVRRGLLEQAAAAWLPPLNLSPVTDDVELAREWFQTMAPAGIEGLVVKAGAEPYRGGARQFLKVKRRLTLDVLCGAVTGPMSAPWTVVVGLPIEGELRIVGRTGPLSPGARRALAAALEPPRGVHPWPARVTSGAFGRFNRTREPVELTLVEPIVVEVSADNAWSGSSFRHLLTYLRVRPEVPVEDVAGI